MTTDIKKLSSVPYTLMIPLVARARGREFFPDDYVDDPTATHALESLHTRGEEFMHKGTVRAIIDRTRIFTRLARNFFERNPHAAGADIGAGLSDYFQWLDNGTNTFVDADLPEVMRVRETLIKPRNARHGFVDASLASPDWWDALKLPNKPVVIIIEGVLMYLTPEQSQEVLRTFAERAAPGSELIFDFMCWLGVGHASETSPVMKHTRAQFKWGVRRLSELTAADSRLQLLSLHPLLSSQSFFRRIFSRAFHFVMGVPLYGIARIGVR